MESGAVMLWLRGAQFWRSAQLACAATKPGRQRRRLARAMRDDMVVYIVEGRWGWKLFSQAQKRQCGEV